MLLTLYDSNKEKKAVLAPSDSSVQDKALQSDNVLSLSLSHYDCIVLEVNDYVEFLGERYWVAERYCPKQKSAREWVYDVKLYGIESLIKRFLVIKSTDGDNDVEFTLTAPASEQVALIVRAINDGMGTSDWKVGTVVATENLVVDYEGTYCDEGLKKVAELAETEYWIEGTTVNVCRCEHGEELTLAYGRGITGLERGTADNVKFYTRLFPLGSTRNIDPDKYGHSRLQLPSGKKYVDINTDKYGIIHHYESAAFEKIFPRRIGTVSSVRSREVKDENGKPYTIYYFTDNTQTFDPNDYELPGKTKTVSFQDGELDGRDFEVNYDSRTREFEIITTWPYSDDTQVPGGLLVPKPGDHYILWNIRMPDEYYALAEQEYEQAVSEYNRKHGIDTSVYKCPTDHVYVEDHDLAFSIGLRVRLESPEFFPESGYRSSRITKITRKVTLPSQMDLEISDAVSVGTMEKMEDSITGVKNYTKVAVGNFPDVIRSWDNTYPTDSNVFSARRALKESISKQHQDTAKEKITFLKGIDLGTFKSGESGGSVDEEGNAEFLTAVIRDLVRSTKFVDGMTGEGLQLWIDRITGLTNLTIDKATIRQSLVALELLIEKVRSVGGQLVVSAANGKIKDVVRQGNDYRITFEQENMFVAHDLMRCAYRSGGAVLSYWVEVASSDAGGVTVPVSEYAGVVPKAGDDCVLMGNTENKLRQNLISISATEDGQPRLDILDGVSAKNFNGCLRARLGSLDGIKDSKFPASLQPKGYGLYSDNVFLKGTFVLMTGEDILTRFSITEGKITSAVEGLRNEVREEQSYFDNTSFAEGMEKWVTEHKATFLTFGGKWVWANGGPLSSKHDGNVEVRNDGKKPYVYIRGSYIMQRNEDFRMIPDYKETNSEGLRVPGVVYLSFRYKVVQAGRLRIDFVDADKSGFENFNMFTYDGELPVSGGEKVFNLEGLWNGTGDFKLSFTGIIQISLLVFSTDRADALAYKYKTLFEQSDKLVKIAAANFDKDGNILEASQIVTKADMNVVASGLFDENGHLVSGAGLITKKDVSGLFAVDKDGTLKSFIGASTSGVKIKADSISLEGLVTANSHFKIKEDGSFEANAGRLGGFEISNGRIGSIASAGGGGGGLAIYDDFIRVGSTSGYVMFGDDVIPVSAGGAFTAAGRIVNKHPNAMEGYGFDQANYGLFINVSGGTKNYGIYSDASLLAPAFINTKARLLTFGSGNYTVDFSQHNIILLYYNQPGYDRVEVTLPTEYSVARQFGLNSIPSDFAATVTFRVRPGSKNIILKGIYDHNENIVNYEMASGDSVVVLITKADGFRYQILNHSR